MLKFKCTCVCIWFKISNMYFLQVVLGILCVNSLLKKESVLLATTVDSCIRDHIHSICWGLGYSNWLHLLCIAILRQLCLYCCAEADAQWKKTVFVIQTVTVKSEWRVNHVKMDFLFSRNRKRIFLFPDELKEINCRALCDLGKMIMEIWRINLNWKVAYKHTTCDTVAALLSFHFYLIG